MGTLLYLLLIKRICAYQLSNVNISLITHAYVQRRNGPADWNSFFDGKERKAMTSSTDLDMDTTINKRASYTQFYGNFSSTDTWLTNESETTDKGK